MEDLLKVGAAYIRVSDERQDEYSPDSQLKKIREYAAREGYLIPDEYVFYDDGISGKNDFSDKIRCVCARFLFPEVPLQGTASYQKLLSFPEAN